MVRFATVNHSVLVSSIVLRLFPPPTTKAHTRLHCQWQTSHSSRIVPETHVFVSHVTLTHKSRPTLMDLSVPSAAQCLLLVHSPKPVKADIPH